MPVPVTASSVSATRSEQSQSLRDFTRWDTEEFNPLNISTTHNPL